MNTIRLFRLLQESGFASRRNVRQLIQMGKIKVNQRIIRDPNFPVDCDRDTVHFRNRLLKLRPERKRYFILNKPTGVVSTLFDAQRRPTIKDLIGGIHERVYPVGRLDYQSEGLILLTNDGELTNFIISAKNKVPKIYLIKIKGSLSDGEKSKLERGLFFEGTRLNPFHIEPVKQTPQGNSWLRVTISEGKKHILRKAFQFCGHPVEKLKRIAIGTITLKNIKTGQWRELPEADIQRLRKKFSIPASRQPEQKTGKIPER